jgi:hypothetical protein
MKKIYLSIMMSCLLYVSSFAQTVIPPANELVLPRFAYFGGSTNAEKIQLVARLKLTGLTPNTTYKQLAGVSDVSTETTSTPGLLFYIDNTTGIIGAANNKGLTTLITSNNFGAGSFHSQFTTDANGEYTGWFATAALGTNAAAGTKNEINDDVYFYVHINNGGATPLTTSFRTTNTIKLLDYSAVSGGITAIIGASTVGSEKMVNLYDNSDLTGRPLYTTWTENDGINLTQLSLFNNALQNTVGAWGAIIPNNLATGVRGIQYLNIDGTSAGAARTSADGTFGGVNTVNPSGGTTPINLDPTVLPITLTNFTGEAKDFGVRLNWATSNEVNNQYFEVLRAGEDRNFVAIGKVNGAGNSSENKSYSFSDFNPLNGNNYYQLKQVDFDGKSSSFGPVAIKFGLSENSFTVLSTTESSVTVSIFSSAAKQAEISYIGLDGRILNKQSISLTKGSNVFDMPIDKSSGSIGIINYRAADGEQKSLKVAR